MRDYYIFSSGNLRRPGNTLEVEKSDEQKRSIPINDVHSMHLFGEIDIDTKVIVFLSQSGIPLHFYNYYGYYCGSFYPGEKLLFGFLSVKQAKHCTDSSKRIGIAFI